MDGRGEKCMKGWRGLVAGVAVVLDALDPQLRTSRVRHLPDMRGV